MLTHRMPWDYILILAILAILVPWRSSARVRALMEGPPLSGSERIQLYLSTMALQWILVAIILWRTHAHRLPLASLGVSLPHPQRAIVIAAVLSFILVLNQIFGLRRIATLPPERRGIIPKLAEKLLPGNFAEGCVAVALVVSVGICEELIFRGFVQTVFQSAIMESVAAGAIISALFFSLAHLYQGRRGIFTTFLIGLIFSGARIWTGSLFPPMFIHFCVDLSAGIVVSRLPSLQPTVESHINIIQ